MVFAVWYMQNISIVEGVEPWHSILRAVSAMTSCVKSVMRFGHKKSTFTNVEGAIKYPAS